MSLGRKQHQTGDGTATRGLGPFTSGHLTAIVLTVVIVAGFPFAAGAVTGNVFVTDATSGAHAKVNSKGQLSTNLSSAIVATPAAPGDLVFSHQLVHTPDPACAFLTAPAGKAMVITGISLTIAKATATSEVQADFWVDPQTGCGSAETLVDNLFFPSDAPYTANYSPGVAIASGHNLDVFTHGGDAGAFVEFTVHGYYVPASACNTGCL